MISLFLGLTETKDTTLHDEFCLLQMFDKKPEKNCNVM